MGVIREKMALKQKGFRTESQRESVVVENSISCFRVLQAVKKNNSCLVVRKVGTGKILSKEKGNLYNENSFKYSGLANAKVLN